MKIIEIFGGEPINKGGQQSFVLYTLQNMDLSDAEVDLFTPYYADNEELIRFVQSHNGQIYAGGLPYIVGQSRTKMISPLRDFLANHHYDVAHIHSGSITALAYSAREASKAGIPKVIVHSHSSGAKENIKHRLVKAYAAPFFTKYATNYCACSMEAAKWKFPRNVMIKAQIINNGIDVDYFAFDPYVRKDMRDQYGIDDDTLILGHVGRFTFEKNQAFLIQLLKTYKERYNRQHVKLVLIGDGPDKPRIIAKAQEYGLMSDVLFPTEYDKVRDYLQMFDIFLFPSLYEGLGIAAIEAQASGLPVIASTGVPLEMKHIEKVEYVSIADKEQWCNAIESFKSIGRKDERSRFHGSRFDIKETAKRIEKLYKSKDEKK
ncbi:MAG: glycosyltransferase [Parasporobacterium sp.]|nr:glycosyltransferase [Parasporobacterium sp.]